MQCMFYLYDINGYYFQTFTAIFFFGQINIFSSVLSKKIENIIFHIIGFTNKEMLSKYNIHHIQ